MRIASLDALRGLAAFSVAIPHFFMAHLPDAGIFEAISILSVEIFFILSGFVLAPQIIYCIEQDSAQRFKIFVIRRWMRTIPPYTLALLFTAIVTGNLFSKQFFKLAFFAQNMVQIDSIHDFFPVAWSLSIEEWFYIIFPLFMFVAHRLGGGVVRSALAFMGVFFIVRLTGALLLPDWSETARRLVAFRLDSIAFGFSLYMTLDRMNAARRRFIDKIIGPVMLVATVMVGGLFYLFAVGRPGVVFTLFYFYAAPAFAMSILTYFYLRNDRWSGSTLLPRLAAISGNISYDVYLVHTAAIVVLGRVMDGAGMALQFAAFLATVVGVSLLMRSMFEQPILDARPSYPDFKD